MEIVLNMNQDALWKSIALNKYYFLPAILCVIACVIAIENIASVIYWHMPVPFSDEWDEFPRLIALHNGGVRDSLAFMWEQHNEHRIVIPKIIYLIDMTFFKYQGYFPIIYIFLLQAMVVGMLSWLFVGKARKSPESLWFVVLTIISAFNLVQWENFASTFQTSFVGCFAFSVTAFVLYAKYAITNRYPYFLGAVLTAMLASLSLASGLFVWLVLAWLAYLIRGRCYVQSFAFVGTFLLLLLFYLYGYTRPEQHANPVDSLISHPIVVLNYLTIWMGSVSKTIASANLLGTIALFVVLVITRYSIYDKNRNHRIEIYTLLGICLFILITGFITALGRINFGVAQAMSSRYGTPVLILWVSLLGMLLLFALESKRVLYVRSIIGLILIIFIGLAIRNLQKEADLTIFQNEQIKAYLAIVVGGYKEQPELLRPIYPVPNSIFDKIDLLKSQKISSFYGSDRNPFSIGTMFPLTGMQQTNDCKGHIDSVKSVGENTYQVTGWAWNENLSFYPAWIFLVQSGKVIGFGKQGIPRPDVLTALPLINKMRVGWQGVARDTGGIRLDNIEAYIFTQYGKYCRL